MSVPISQLNKLSDPVIEISGDNLAPSDDLVVNQVENQDQDLVNEKTVMDLHKDEEIKQNIENREKNQGVKSIINPSRLLNDVRYRNNVLSASNAFLHGLATVTNFVAKNNPALKFANHIVDRSAFFCTRWLTPYISYGHAVYSALTKQQEPILALIKAIPPAFFPIVGDANIDMVYGASTACNQPYDNVMNRIKEKINDSEDYAVKMKEIRKSPLAFTGAIVDEFKSFVGDFVKGKSDFWKEGIFVVNCSMMLAGSIPMLLFGRDQRDTTLAKISGVLRNVGGCLGDAGWVFGRGIEKEKRLIGIVYTLAQIADIAKRFVSEDVSKVLIHLSAALNVSAMTVWNTINTEGNKDTIDDIVSKKLNKSQLLKKASVINEETALKHLAA